MSEQNHIRQASRSALVVMDDSVANPDEQFREYFKQFRINDSVNPIPYDKSLAQNDTANTPLGDFKSRKVTVVGCGQVGMAIAYSILNQDLCGILALVDVQKKKLEGEAKDLLQGSAFHERCHIDASDDYAISAKSNLVIVTAGAAQKQGESRLSLVERNVKIMKIIMPQVLKYSPEAPICIVSNPCDIMTAVAAKIAGPSYPPGRIFGSGTCLDSSRLRSLMAKSMDLNAQNIHGYVIGEHGDSSVPVWSSVRIGALPLLKPGEEPSETLIDIHKEVVGAAGDVIALKGYTNWAIGLTAAHITKAILTDARSIMPLSTCVRGLYGVEEDVFLSVPCSVTTTGIQRIAVLPLTDGEKANFCKSAKTVWGIQQGVWDKI